MIFERKRQKDRDRLRNRNRDREQNLSLPRDMWRRTDRRYQKTLSVLGKVKGRQGSSKRNLWS